LITIENYINEHLSKEFDEVKAKIPPYESQILTDHEKTLIYHYTGGGYNVNEKLLDGKTDVYAKLLSIALSKLPDYKNIVYRGVFLSQSSVKAYKNSFADKAILHYPAFMSTTKKRTIAGYFPGINHNCLMEIISKKGKDIEGVSKFGKHASQNEYEVLFNNNSKFRILDLQNDNCFYSIKMEEIK
jgi:hypothetical protein